MRTCEYVWRDGRCQHRAQQQFAECVIDGLERRPTSRLALARPPTCKGRRSATSAQLSQLAMIEMSDSVSPDCLTAVGQYRAGRSQNGTANSSLTQQQFDTTFSNEQRGSTVEPSERRSSPTVDRDAGAGRNARLSCLSDDCRQHAAAQCRSTGFEHGGCCPTATDGERHQRGQ